VTCQIQSETSNQSTNVVKLAVDFDDDLPEGVYPLKGTLVSGAFSDTNVLFQITFKPLKIDGEHAGRPEMQVVAERTVFAPKGKRFHLALEKSENDKHETVCGIVVVGQR
jgi:hypothetical protein